MRFDYSIGTEATFYDWVLDGCEKAEKLIDSLDKKEEKETEDKDLT